MKCPICGFDIEKPNQKTCPLCGYKLTQKDVVADERVTSQETPPSVPFPEKEVSNRTGVIHKQPTPPPPLVECSLCHNRIPEDSRTCPYCGTAVQSDSNGWEREYHTPIEQSDAANQAPYETPQDHAYPEENDKRDSTSASARVENYRVEDYEQYIKNGSFIPDPGETETEISDETEVKGSSAVSQTMVYIIAAVLSIAIGALLYHLI